MSLTKPSLGGKCDVLYKLFLPRESFVSDSPAGDGNIKKLFYCVGYAGFSRNLVTVYASRVFKDSFYNLPGRIGRLVTQPRYRLHRKKKVREFPVPSRDVTTKLSLGGNNDVITELFLPKGSLVSDIPPGDGKLVNLFLRCMLLLVGVYKVSFLTGTGE
jgi:hypothetical protein